MGILDIFFSDNKDCPECNGSGKDYNYSNLTRCPKCDGYGCNKCKGFDRDGYERKLGYIITFDKCNRCSGTGKVENKPERLF